MLFVWLGFLKPEAEIDPALQQQISGFLQQPYLPIQSAGVLRDESRRRAGYIVIVEAESREAAEALVRDSPIRHAGLYSEYHLLEYQQEVG